MFVRFIDMIKNDISAFNFIGIQLCEARENLERVQKGENCVI